MSKQKKHNRKPDDEALEENEILEEVLEEEEILQTEAVELEKIAALLEEGNQRYLRIAAEYDNYRKRTNKEKDGIYPQAQADTIGKFLPIVDSLDRALEFDCDTEEFVKGIELIRQNLTDMLQGFSVEEIGEVGEQFDPDLHNAILHVEDPKLGDNVVSQVLQKGYRIGDRVIRYATVQTAN